MPDKNVFIGWGDHAYFSEHLPSGEAVMYEEVAQRASDVMIYRSNKYVWKGEPLSTPSMWIYLRTGSGASNIVFYVSWNGAAEARYWNFYTSDSATGPWDMIGSTNRTGFETDYILTGSRGWAYAEALDAERNLLKRGRSSIVKIFVSSDLIVSGCDDIMPLREGEKFNQAMPDIGNRGDNYTADRGVNTVNYSPVSEYTIRGWPDVMLAIAAALILLITTGFYFMLGKRRL
ncbi:uncharacterized protein EKO05_0009747 [Ascochyta rabiei]|nr:uncharacterized protein EKO05_0009747 [Ascochyta rabiei]UPX19487.1 hypothetical protein EKO05_0009747 [Ascochyta rabiei]